MSPAEARFWGECLRGYSRDQISPLINLGSSTRHYREISCPFIHQEIFAPLEVAGVQAVHVDLKEAPGVDVAGDIVSPQVQQELATFSPRSILCSNLLEHVRDRSLLIKAMDDLLPPGGLLFLSVPAAYPFHPDPIDTGFRPSVEELAAGFPAYRILQGAVVEFGNYWGELRKKRWLLVRDLFLAFGGVSKRDRWRVLFGNYQFFLRHYAMSCVVLQRPV